MSTPVSTQIQLAARPQGWPTHDDFRTVRVPLWALEAGRRRARERYSWEAAAKGTAEHYYALLAEMGRS